MSILKNGIPSALVYGSLVLSTNLIAPCASGLTWFLNSMASKRYGKGRIVIWTKVRNTLTCRVRLLVNIDRDCPSVFKSTAGFRLYFQCHANNIQLTPKAGTDSRANALEIKCNPSTHKFRIMLYRVQSS